MQNESAYASHLMPAKALLAVSACLAQGVRSHGRDNWRLGAIETHVGRAATHLLLHQAGGGEGYEGAVEELTHAACRALFALELEINATLAP